MRDNPFFQGVICLLAGSVLWGFSGACTQYLFAHYAVSSLFITVVRMVGAGLLFLAYLLAAQRSRVRTLLSDRVERQRLAAFGVLGLFACQLTYIVTIGYTNAGIATVLQSLCTVIVLAVTCAQVHRHPYRLEIIGVVCALAATVLIATKGDLGTLNMPLLGLVWGLGTAAAESVYVLLSGPLTARWGSLVVTGLGMLAGGVAAFAVFAASGAVFAATGGAAGQPVAVPVLGADGWLMLVLIVVFGTFGAFGLFIHGLSIVGGVRGTLLGTMEPVAATCFSALWLGTAFGWADWAGLVLMVAMVFLVTLQKAR